MNTPAWTPGPWQVDDEHGSLVIRSHEHGLIADIAPFGDSRKPDAHLIAASPDLYEALAATLESYVSVAASGDCGFWDPEEEPHVINARAALAKARGDA